MNDEPDFSLLRGGKLEVRPFDDDLTSDQRIGARLNAVSFAAQIALAVHAPERTLALAADLYYLLATGRAPAEPHAKEFWK